MANATKDSNTKTTPRKAWQSYCRELATFAWEHLAIKRERHGQYSPDGGARWSNENDELTKVVLAEHFAGETTIGCGTTSVDDECLWVAWDLDNHTDGVTNVNLDYAIVLMNRLADLGVHAVIEDSDFKGGIHVWVFFDRPVPSEAAYWFADWIARDYEEHGLEVIECFPKQPSVQNTPKKCGNYLRTPGKHHKREHWSRFYDAGKWLDAEESIKLLLNAPINDPACLSQRPEDYPEERRKKRQAKQKTQRDNQPAVPVSVDITVDKATKHVAAAEAAIEQVPFESLLLNAGWTHYTGDQWTRPGDDWSEPKSATLGVWNGQGRLTVWSSAAPIEGGTTDQRSSYSKWRFWYASSNFGDSDQIEAAKEFLGQEVSAQIDSAYFNGLDDESVIEVDLTAILNQNSNPADPPEQTLDEPGAEPERASITAHSNLPDELCNPPGFIGELVQYMDDTAEYSCPELFLAAALSLLATITGRKVKDYRGTRPNLYCIGAGPSGCGKDHGRKIVRRLLGETNLEGPENFTSESAVAESLQLSPSLLVQMDEIGLCLKEAFRDSNSNSHLKKLMAAMMKVFTSSNGFWKPTGFADSKNTKSVEQPNLVIHGTTTAASFFDAITGAEVANGFAGRLMVFLSPNGGYSPQKPFDQHDAPKAITRFIDEWISRDCGPGNLSIITPDPPAMDITEDALSRIKSHFSDISRRRMKEDSTTAAIWSRASEKTSKLAMLAAISRGSETIDIQDANWSIKVVNFLTRRLLAMIIGNVARSSHERDVLKVRAIVEEAGVLGVSTLTRKTQWLKKRDRNDIVDQLIEAGEFIPVIRKTVTRPAKGIAVSRQAIQPTEWELLQVE